MPRLIVILGPERNGKTRWADWLYPPDTKFRPPRPKQIATGQWWDGLQLQDPPPLALHFDEWRIDNVSITDLNTIVDTAPAPSLERKGAFVPAAQLARCECVLLVANARILEDLWSKYDGRTNELAAFEARIAESGTAFTC